MNQQIFKIFLFLIIQKSEALNIKVLIEVAFLYLNSPCTGLVFCPFAVYQE